MEALSSAPPTPRRRAMGDDGFTKATYTEAEWKQWRKEQKGWAPKSRGKSGFARRAAARARAASQPPQDKPKAAP